jgi:long-chain acyl-CoA synthetase
MLSHTNVMAAILTLEQFVAAHDVRLGPEDVYLSYLPLAHIFDRTSEELYLYLGASIGYWRGDIKGLMEDIGAPPRGLRSALRPAWLAHVDPLA